MKFSAKSVTRVTTVCLAVLVLGASVSITSSCALFSKKKKSDQSDMLDTTNTQANSTAWKDTVKGLLACGSVRQAADTAIKNRLKDDLQKHPIFKKIPFLDLWDKVTGVKTVADLKPEDLVHKSKRDKAIEASVSLNPGWSAIDDLTGGAVVKFLTGYLVLRI